MKNIALVIGINDYVHTDVYPKLHSAVKDAEDIANKLTELKFDTQCCLDEDKDTVHSYWCDFIEKISLNEYDVAVVYFAGHGVIANHYDCLLMKEAIKVNTTTGMLPEGHALKVQQMINEMRNHGDQINILILDACRHVVSLRGVATDSFGVTSKIPYQTFIAYSTSPGRGAIDGTDTTNSPYAESLLNHIGEENLPIETLFKTVRKEIQEKGIDQLTWENSCLVDDFCFNYGQNNKYHNAPYSEEAFCYSMFTPKNDYEKNIIGLITAEPEDYSSFKRDFITLYLNTDRNTQFIVGRMICNKIVEGNKTLDKLIADISLLRLLGEKTEWNIIKGIYYELYFDVNDDLRSEILGDSNFLTMIEKMRLLLDNKDSENFIKNYVIPYEFLFDYIIGGNRWIQVNIKYEAIDYCDNEGHEIRVLSSIDYEDTELRGEIEFQKGLISEKALREEIVRYLKIPLQLLKISIPNRRENVVYTLYNMVDMENSITNTMNNSIPDEIDCLSSLSYVEETNDIIINNVVADDKDEISVKGNCTVVVHLEYDHEDSGSMSFPCHFECIMQRSEDGTFKIDEGTCKYHVNTESFYH